MTTDCAELVGLYRRLRDARKEIEDRQKAELAVIDSNLSKIEGALGKFMDDHKTVNLKTQYGTAFWKTRYSSPLVNPDLFLQWVRDNELWTMLDRKANVTAVRDYVKANAALPPGADLKAMRRVHIVKAGAKIDDDADQGDSSNV